MTAPFAPPPHPVVWTITIGLIAVTVALPFARRDDWLGWLALCTIAGVSILLWAILIVGLLGRIVAWYRDRPRKGEGLDACVCYKDHIYQLTWDCDTFALQNFSGHRVLGVPRDRAFEVIDADAFFVEGEVTVDTPRVRFTFPASRSERAQLMTLIQELTRSSSFFHEELARRRKVSPTWPDMAARIVVDCPRACAADRNASGTQTSNGFVANRWAGLRGSVALVVEAVCVCHCLALCCASARMHSACSKLTSLTN